MRRSGALRDLGEAELEVGVDQQEGEDLALLLRAQDRQERRRRTSVHTLKTTLQFAKVVIRIPGRSVRSRRTPKMPSDMTICAVIIVGFMRGSLDWRWLAASYLSDSCRWARHDNRARGRPIGGEPVGQASGDHSGGHFGVRCSASKLAGASVRQRKPAFSPVQSMCGGFRNGLVSHGKEKVYVSIP